MFFRGRVVSCCGLWLLFCRRMTPSGRGWRAFAPANAISVTLYYKLNFNFIRDTTPVAGISLGPLVIEVDPTVPPQDGSRVYCLRQGQSGQDQFASPGNGAVIHLGGELFKMMNMVHVPYRDLLGGWTDRQRSIACSNRLMPILPFSAARILSGRSPSERPCGSTRVPSTISMNGAILFPER